MASSTSIAPLTRATSRSPIRRAPRSSSRNRRFVIGRGLNETAGMKKFTASAAGPLWRPGCADPELDQPDARQGRRQPLCPWRRHACRKSSSRSCGSANGAKPMSARSRCRSSSPGRSLISSGQTAVTLYQAQPVSEKQQPRELLAGHLCAGRHADFRRASADVRFHAPKTRASAKCRCNFLLSREADRFNNQDVFLKLRERVGKTSHYEDYASHRFQLRRGITTDFDF